MESGLGTGGSPSGITVTSDEEAQRRYTRAQLAQMEAHLRRLWQMNPVVFKEELERSNIRYKLQHLLPGQVVYPRQPVHSSSPLESPNTHVRLTTSPPAQPMTRLSLPIAQPLQLERQQQHATAGMRTEPFGMPSHFSMNSISGRSVSNPSSSIPPDMPAQRLYAARNTPGEVLQPMREASQPRQNSYAAQIGGQIYRAMDASHNSSVTMHGPKVLAGQSGDAVQNRSQDNRPPSGDPRLAPTDTKDDKINGTQMPHASSSSTAPGITKPVGDDASNINVSHLSVSQRAKFMTLWEYRARALEEFKMVTNGLLKVPKTDATAIIQLQRRIDDLQGLISRLEHDLRVLSPSSVRKERAPSANQERLREPANTTTPSPATQFAKQIMIDPPISSDAGTSPDNPIVVYDIAAADAGQTNLIDLPQLPDSIDTDFSSIENIAETVLEVLGRHPTRLPLNFKLLPLLLRPNPFLGPRMDLTNLQAAMDWDAFDPPAKISVSSTEMAVDEGNDANAVKVGGTTEALEKADGQVESVLEKSQFVAPMKSTLQADPAQSGTTEVFPVAMPMDVTETVVAGIAPSEIAEDTADTRDLNEVVSVAEPIDAVNDIAEPVDVNEESNHNTAEIEKDGEMLSGYIRPELTVPSSIDPQLLTGKLDTQVRTTTSPLVASDNQDTAGLSTTNHHSYPGGDPKLSIIQTAPVARLDNLITNEDDVTGQDATSTSSNPESGEWIARATVTGSNRIPLEKGRDKHQKSLSAGQVGYLPNVTHSGVKVDSPISEVAALRLPSGPDFLPTQAVSPRVVDNDSMRVRFESERRPVSRILDRTRQASNPGRQYRVFKCKWSECPSKFHNLELLESHLSKAHQSPPGDYKCLWKGCRTSSGTKYEYENQAELDKHIQDVHLREIYDLVGAGPSSQEIRRLITEEGPRVMKRTIQQTWTPLAIPAPVGYKFAVPENSKARLKPAVEQEVKRLKTAGGAGWHPEGDNNVAERERSPSVADLRETSENVGVAGNAGAWWSLE